VPPFDRLGLQGRAALTVLAGRPLPRDFRTTLIETIPMTTHWYRGSMTRPIAAVDDSEVATLRYIPTVMTVSTSNAAPLATFPRQVGLKARNP